MPMFTFEQAQRHLNWTSYLATYQGLIDGRELTLENVKEQFILDAELSAQAHYEAIQEHNAWQSREYYP